MRISYWSTDVCSSDLHCPCSPARGSGSARDTVPGYPAFVAVVRCEMENLLRRGGDRPILLRREELLRVQRRHAAEARGRDRKSTRLNPVTNAHLVCRLLLEKKKTQKHQNIQYQQQTYISTQPHNPKKIQQHYIKHYKTT